MKPFVILAGCQQQPTTLTEARKTEINDQITDRINEFVESVRALDADAIVDLLSQDAFIAYVTIDQHFDRQTLLDTLKNDWFAGRETQQFDITKLQVYPLSSDLALSDLDATGHILWKDSTASEGYNVFTFLWKNEPSGWKIVHYNESWRYETVVE